MRGRRILVGVFIASAAFGLMGCEGTGLDEPNYVIVTFECKVFVSVLEDGVEQPVLNALVQMEINKAGGERVSDLVSIAGHLGGKLTGTFNVYKEQPLNCIGNVVLESVGEQYPGYVFNSQVSTIAWSQIGEWEFGDHARFYRTLSIVGVKD